LASVDGAHRLADMQRVAHQTFEISCSCDYIRTLIKADFRRPSSSSPLLISGSPGSDPSTRPDEWPCAPRGTLATGAESHLTMTSHLAGGEVISRRLSL
jgi:hypothetical protein